MKFLFDDEAFSFETLRAAGYASYGGADLGEIVTTARAIRGADEASWHAGWRATAERVHAQGERSLAAGHRVSAREALLRASNYYRTAEFFLREHPATDPDVRRLSVLSRETFAKAAGMLDSPFEIVRIPYEGTTLPGHLFLVDDSGVPRPTLIYNSGYDSTLEEAYFAIGAAALRRGYNVLAFDGPGQGAALREQGLVFRPDWEAVITPVVDHVLGRQEVASDGIVLFGFSLGGYLVARAAAFEHRVAALVLDDGVYDFHAAIRHMVPPFLAPWIEQGHDGVANAAVSMLTSFSTKLRWGVRNGMWAMGAGSFPDLLRKFRAYTLEPVADQVTAPTLIMDAENDQFFRGQPQQVEAALVNAPTTLVTLREAEGAGEHCHMGGLLRGHQVIFDWLEPWCRPTTRGQPSRRSTGAADTTMRVIPHREAPVSGAIPG